MIHLLYQAPDPRAGRDGVLDYSRNLVDALRRGGAPAVLWRRTPSGWLADDGTEAARPAPSWSDGDWALLQYSPFALGRGGVAPWVLPALHGARRAGVRGAVTVHEPYVAMGSPKQSIMSVAQRLQLALLLPSARVVFAATEAWRPYLRRVGLRSTPVVPICSGSNLPTSGLTRPDARARLGVPPDHLVLVSFGTGHDSRLPGFVRAAATSLGEQGPVTLFALGAEGAAGPPPPSVHQVSPGYLPASDVADVLAAGDVALMPFVDGVSGRRTSVAACLQHGVPVVSTDGVHTEEWWRGRAAVHLSELDPGAYARAAALAAPPSADARRDALALYGDRFAWDVLAGITMSALGSRP